MFSLPPQSYSIALLKREVFALQSKSFLKYLLRQGREEKKNTGSAAIVN